MIRIELDEVTVARTRIATSPLWETVCSLLLLSRNPTDVPWPYTAWAERARRVLATVPAAAPARLYGGQLDGSSPDFFDGVPTSPAPTLEEELERVCATDPQVIAEQLAKHYPDGVPPALVPFRDTPGPALRRLADGVLAYWEGRVARYWPGMRAALEEEVLLRARGLAADGPDALLADLHARVRWEPPILTLVKPLEHTFTVRNQRLVLIPLIFSRGALTCTSDHPDVIAVSYQARGAALLAGGTGMRGATPPGDDPPAPPIRPGRAAPLRRPT